ncbi:hypothetical protein VCRA2123E76_150106 [Vibrio crassostreae]|nr:hypothetical protein VCRA2123E76_150106 [Vibrio crassostreae]
MSYAILMTRVPFVGLSPEAKFAIIKLLHKASVSDGDVTAKSVRELSGDIKVSVSAILEGIRYLERNNFLTRDGDWTNSGESNKKKRDIKCLFLGGFYEHLDSGNSDLPKLSEVVCQRARGLLDSAAFNQFSNRAAIKLFLLTLVVLSDDYCVVRGKSIKDFRALLGRFTKDSHRSQLAQLKRAEWIVEYDSGFSGKVLIGRCKSEYLLNARHPALATAKHEKITQAIIKLYGTHQQTLVGQLNKLIQSTRPNEEESSSEAMIQAKSDGVDSEPKPNFSLSSSFSDKTDQELTSSNLVGELFFDEVAQFHIQRLSLKAAFNLIRSNLIDDAIWHQKLEVSLTVGSLFSQKYKNEIEELIESKKDLGLEGFLLSQVINLLEGEGCGRNPKSQRYLSQLKAIHFLLSLMIKESSEALEVVLKDQGLGLRSDSQLEVYRSGNETITLYLFNMVHTSC